MYKLSQGLWEFRKSSGWAWSRHLGSRMFPANPGPLCSPWSPWITRRPSESRNRNASPARMLLGPFCDAVAPRTWGCWWRRDGWRNSDDLASGVLRATKPSDGGPGDAALESSGSLRGPGSTLSRLHVRQGSFVLVAGRVGMRRFVPVAALRAAVWAALRGFPTRFLAQVLVALEALLPPQIAAVFEHVAGIGVKGPKRAFARLIRGARHFQEAVVEGQRVADRVLPALLVLSVKREKVHYPLIDLTEGQHLTGRLLDGHGY